MRNPKLTFKKSMVWEKEIEDFIKERTVGYSLNCPCGESNIGTVRIDIVKKPNVTQVADMYQIPFDRNTFDTVISDPVWKIKSYFHRMKAFFEIVRVCKVGGTIIYNATWLPESKAVKLEEIWSRQSARFGNVSIIGIYTKITDEFDKDVKP